jgi:hypothetical protein
MEQYTILGVTHLFKPIIIISKRTDNLHNWLIIDLVSKKSNSRKELSKSNKISKFGSENIGFAFSHIFVLLYYILDIVIVIITSDNNFPMWYENEKICNKSHILDTIPTFSHQISEFYCFSNSSLLEFHFFEN